MPPITIDHNLVHQLKQQLKNPFDLSETKITDITKKIVPKHPKEKISTPQTQEPPKAVKRLYSGTGFMFGSKDYVITNWNVIRGTKI